MIDFHVHLGDLYFPRKKRNILSLEQLIDTMNRLGIEMSVLLPLDSPEASGVYFSTFEALEACRKYPERLITAIVWSTVLNVLLGCCDDCEISVLSLLLNQRLFITAENAT